MKRSVSLILSVTVIMLGAGVLALSHSPVVAQARIGDDERRLIQQYQSQISELDAEEGALNRDLLENDVHEANLKKTVQTFNKYRDDLLNNYVTNLGGDPSKTNRAIANLKGIIEDWEGFIYATELKRAQNKARIENIKVQRQFLYNSLDIERQRLPQASEGSGPGRTQTFPNPMSGGPKLSDVLGRQWEEFEGPWTGTWNRRGTSNEFDAVWTNSSGSRVEATLQIDIRDNAITIVRKQVAGTCDYRGRLQGITASGNFGCTWSPGPHPWHAVIK